MISSRVRTGVTGAQQDRHRFPGQPVTVVDDSTQGVETVVLLPRRRRLFLVRVGQDFRGIQVEDQRPTDGGPCCGVAGTADGPGGSTGIFHAGQHHQGGGVVSVGVVVGEFFVAAMHRGV